MLKLFNQKEVKESQSQKSIFMARKVRKYYEFNIDGGGDCHLNKMTETLERVKILEKEMKFEFNNYEEIFLEEIGKYTKIEKKTKDTNGNTIYNITYVTEIVEDYDDELKEEYDASKKIWDDGKADRELENKKIEEERKIQEQKVEEEYIKYCEDKKSRVKKGIIIQKVPTDSDGKLMELDIVQAFHKSVNEKFPDYDIVTTPMDVEIFNYNAEGKLVGLNDEKILFKN